MYPFSTRLRWVVAGRYAHILAAAARNPVTDSLVMERLASMRRWNQVHLVVGSLLLVGLVGAAATAAATLFPQLGGFWAAIRAAAAVIGAFTGLLTLAYLALNRVLGQIEADLLMLLTLRHKTR